MSTGNTELLRRYLSERSEAAFTELVQRNIDLVYSAALRQVEGDAAVAQEVTQNVFTDLARKAPALVRHTSLTGWLYTSTRFLAAKARRSEQRRRARELQAHAMNQLLQNPDADPSWNDLQPLLDDAMHELGAADREVVLMRYFEGRPLAEVGSRLGLTENAARMRVARALEKLRAALVKRGVTSTTAALALLLTQRAVSAAPTGLAVQIGRNAFESSLVSTGVLGGVLTWLTLWKSALLSGGIAVVLLSTAGLVVRAKLHTPPADASPAAVSSAPTTAIISTAPVSLALQDAAQPATSADPASSNRLLLHIVAADAGKPVPNVELDPWIWEAEKVTHTDPIRASRLGDCVVPVERDRVTRLILVSRCDGFADTRLEWRPDRGQQIPGEYTLRLARSVPVGGFVLDPDGKSVAGAEISFGNYTDAAQEGVGPQTDNFGWPFHVTATTDAAGRWRIDRIAAGALRTVEGRAQHPDYVNSESVSIQRKPEAEKQLRDEKYVFRLQPAVVVRGVVVDPNDQPVSEAHVLVGNRSQTGSRETSTAADGTFTVSGCCPGPSPITADAPGFAAVTLEVELSTNSEPFRLTLQPARTLRLRVVNKSGQPVPGASVWLNTFDWSRSTANSNSNRAAVTQVEFHRNTDSEGKVLWESAPDHELSFDIAATGHLRKNRVKVQPDGQEHTITLSPALTISGTVRDAASGQPLPRFRIVTGWPTPDILNNRTNFQWSSIDRFWLSFEGGKFRHVYEEQVVSSEKPYGFVFKFEAEGYAAATSRVVGEDEGEARFDVELRPASKCTITVLSPDGQIASAADIGLASSGSVLRLKPGGFDRENRQSGGSLLRTDQRGQFQLPPDESITRVIAAHPEGFAEAAPAALAAQTTLLLQPWGRLEGVYKSGGRVAAGRELLFEYGEGNYQSISSSFDAYRLKTDAEGRFAFAQVPPGKHKIVQLVESKMSTGNIGWVHQPLADVEIRPGETTSIVVGGCTVTMRLRWPAELAQNTNWKVMASLLPPFLASPEEAKASPAALAAWRAQPEIRKAFARARRYFFSRNPEGAFAAEEVPAGDYQLVVDVLEPSTNGGTPENRLHTEYAVSVPADPPTGTLDLGEMGLPPAW